LIIDITTTRLVLVYNTREVYISHDILNMFNPVVAVEKSTYFIVLRRGVVMLLLSSATTYVLYTNTSLVVVISIIKWECHEICRLLYSNNRIKHV
jgi:hypothetical protein